MRAVPPVPPGVDHVAAPVRFEKRWLQGLSFIKLIVAIGALLPFIFIISLISSAGADADDVLFMTMVFLPMMLPIILVIIVLVLRTRPAAFEMDGTGVRLFRGGKVVKEIPFGPDVHVGVMTVGYWDDMSPGLILRAAGMDENDVSLYERAGFGPLFGYKFRAGGKKIVITRRHGWDIRLIQYMWVHLMTEVNRYQMKLDRSALKYLKDRRAMGLPFP